MINDKKMIADFLGKLQPQLVLEKFCSSVHLDDPWQVNYLRKRAEVLLKKKTITTYPRAELPDEIYNEVDKLHEWLGQFVGTGAVFFCSDDGLELEWQITRPATEEELADAQKYLDTHDEPPDDILKIKFKNY